MARLDGGVQCGSRCLGCVPELAHNPLRVLGDQFGSWAVIIVPPALAFAIGVRFADSWWLAGVFVTDVLWAVILGRAVAGQPAELGSGQAMLGIILGFLFMLPLTLLAAASGVRRGKGRHAAATE